MDVYWSHCRIRMHYTNTCTPNFTYNPFTIRTHKATDRYTHQGYDVEDNRQMHIYCMIKSENKSHISEVVFMWESEIKRKIYQAAHRRNCIKKQTFDPADLQSATERHRTIRGKNHTNNNITRKRNEKPQTIPFYQTIQPDLNNEHNVITNQKSVPAK